MNLPLGMTDLEIVETDINQLIGVLENQSSVECDDQAVAILEEILILLKKSEHKLERQETI